MIGGGSCDFDFQELAEAMCEAWYKGSSVANNLFQESVELPDVVSEQLSHSRCCNVQCHWYDMSVFGQAVHYYHDGVIAMALWYFSYKVHWNDLPMAIRNAIGMSFPAWGAG